MEEKLNEALNYFKRNVPRLKGDVLDSNVLIVSHYDADGLSAASIIAKGLKVNDATFHLKILEQLDEESMEELASLDYDVIIFADMGSGQVDLIEKSLSPSTRAILLDHHQPLKEAESPNIVDFNPHHLGIDGGSQASASTISYLFIKELGADLPELAALAVVGALGDRQDVGRMRSLIGLNRLVLEEGVERGVLSTEVGLRLFGLRNRPLVKCIEYSIDPYLPGLSGDESSVVLFLKKIGIEPAEGGKLRDYSSLSKEEQKRLATELVKYLINMGYSASQAESIFGTLYFLIKEDPLTPLYEAREYATLLNACGRLERHEVAITLGLGYRDRHLQEALRILNEYRRLISSFINRLKNSKEDYVRTYAQGRLVLVDCRDEVPSKAIGALASLLASSKVLSLRGPLIVAGGGDKVKISARLPPSSEYEVNLGEMLAHASRHVGGRGGGHARAAGAVIGRSKLEAFMKFISESILKPPP